MLPWATTFLAVFKLLRFAHAAPLGTKYDECRYDSANYSISWRYDAVSDDVVFRLSTRTDLDDYWTGVYFGETEPTDIIAVFVRGGQIGVVDGRSFHKRLLADATTNVQSLAFDVVEDKMTAEFARPLRSIDGDDVDLSKCTTFFFPVEAVLVGSSGRINLPEEGIRTTRICDLTTKCMRSPGADLVKRDEPMRDETSSGDTAGPICNYKKGEKTSISWSYDAATVRENNDKINFQDLITFDWQQPVKKGHYYSAVGIGDSMKDLPAYIIFSNDDDITNIVAYTFSGYGSPTKNVLQDVVFDKSVVTSTKDGLVAFSFSIPFGQFVAKTNASDCAHLQIAVLAGKYSNDLSIEKHTETPEAIPVCKIQDCADSLAASTSVDNAKEIDEGISSGQLDGNEIQNNREVRQGNGVTGGVEIEGSGEEEPLTGQKTALTEDAAPKEELEKAKTKKQAPENPALASSTPASNTALSSSSSLRPQSEVSEEALGVQSSTTQTPPPADPAPLSTTASQQPAGVIEITGSVAPGASASGEPNEIHVNVATAANVEQSSSSSAAQPQPDGNAVMISSPAPAENSPASMPSAQQPVDAPNAEQPTLSSSLLLPQGDLPAPSESAPAGSSQSTIALAVEGQPTSTGSLASGVQSMSSNTVVLMQTSTSSSAPEARPQSTASVSAAANNDLVSTSSASPEERQLALMTSSISPPQSSVSHSSQPAAPSSAPSPNNSNTTSSPPSSPAEGSGDPPVEGNDAAPVEGEPPAGDNAVEGSGAPQPSTTPATAENAENPEGAENDLAAPPAGGESADANNATASSTPVPAEGVEGSASGEPQPAEGSGTPQSSEDGAPPAEEVAAGNGTSESSAGTGAPKDGVAQGNSSCPSGHQDLAICAPYFDDYLGKVKQWAEKHDSSMDKQMWKACKLLRETPHVSQMCCAVMEYNCNGKDSPPATTASPAVRKRA